MASKYDLYQWARERTHPPLTKEAAKEFTDLLFERAAEILKTGEAIQIRFFGTFKPVFRRRRNQTKLFNHISFTESKFITYELNKLKPRP